jgi:cytoskeletal protein CcmA (bactofilin family)
MFGTKKTKHTPLVMGQEKFDTLIGRHAEIHGCLRLQESVRIDGKVVGNIEAPHDAAISVVIGPTGEIQGDVMASRIIVAGKVSGNLHGFERVELMASALVQGDIRYASMAVEHGARLLGLMLQFEGGEAPVNLALEAPAGLVRDTQAVIRKAKTAGQPE